MADHRHEPGATMRSKDQKDRDEQDAKIVALTVAGRRPVEISKDLGISCETVSRRLRECADQVEAQRREAIEAACGRLAPLMDAALVELARQLSPATQTTDTLRLRAAEVVLSNALRFHSALVIEKKLGDIESRLESLPALGVTVDARSITIGEQIQPLADAARRLTGQSDG